MKVHRGAESRVRLSEDKGVCPNRAVDIVQYHVVNGTPLEGRVVAVDLLTGNKASQAYINGSWDSGRGLSVRNLAK